MEEKEPTPVIAQCHCDINTHCRLHGVRGRTAAGLASIPEIDAKVHALSNALARLQEEREVCICAAIRLENGRVIPCYRHSDGIATAHRMTPGRAPITSAMQGFLTSRNRYVDRLEGMRLQKAAGIPSADVRRGRNYDNDDMLFSEDLY